MSSLSIISFMYGLIPLAIIAGIFYLIIKKRDTSGEGVDLQHAYFYLVSFITLGILFWAVSDLLRLLLKQYVFIEKVSSVSYYSYSSSSYNSFLKALAGRLAAIIVAFPIWGFHWMKANPPQPDDIDKRSRKSYALSVVVVTMIIILVGWPYLLYTLISKVLGVEDKNISNILASSIPYTISATILWFTHFRIWKKLSPHHEKVQKNEISLNTSAPKNNQ